MVRLRSCRGSSHDPDQRNSVFCQSPLRVPRYGANSANRASRLRVVRIGRQSRDIFRLIVIPCTPEVIRKTVEAGIRQYELVMAERRSTRETLLGCDQAFEEILADVNPEALSLGAGREFRNMLLEITALLRVSCPWQYEAASIANRMDYQHAARSVYNGCTDSSKNTAIERWGQNDRESPPAFRDFPASLHDQNGHPAALARRADVEGCARPRRVLSVGRSSRRCCPTNAR